MVGNYRNIYIYIIIVIMIIQWKFVTISNKRKQQQQQQNRQQTHTRKIEKLSNGDLKQEQKKQLDATAHEQRATENCYATWIKWSNKKVRR